MRIVVAQREDVSLYITLVDETYADYGMTSNTLAVHCDNTSAINISKNPVQHSRTKHIDIQHYFIKELVEGKIVEILHVPAEKQLADIFTKPLDLNCFTNLQKPLGICEH